MTRAVPFAGMKIVHAVFGIIVLSVYSQADSDEFGYIIRQTDIYYGNGTAELTCFISKKTFPLQWKKIDPHGVYDPIEISYGQKLIINDSRFSLRIHGTDLLYSIKILDLNENDAGFYECLIEPLNGRPLASVKELEVSRPAKIFDITIRSLVFKEGDEMILECYATGHPNPKILWGRENNTVLPTGGLFYSGNVYTVPNITRNEHGKYYCSAQNGVGKPDRRIVGVEVEFLPVVNITTPRWLVVNLIIDISCNVEAFPLPAIVWIKDEVQILNSEHYKISQVATFNKLVVSKLHVINIKRRHYGNYTCQASNELGTVNSTINMIGIKTHGKSSI